MGPPAEDVRRKRSRTADRGYAAEDVEAFLEEAAETLRGPVDPEDLISLISRLLESHPQLEKVHEELAAVLRVALLQEDVAGRIGGDAERVLGPEEIMDADDLLAEARAAGEVRRRVLDEEMLDAAAVSRVLGSQSVNPRQYANTLRRRGDVVGVPHRNQYLYPAFQLDRERGRVDAVALEVNRLLGAGDDPWGVASWWLSANDRLGGRTPSEALGDPEARDRLVAIAGSLLEPIG